MFAISKYVIDYKFNSVRIRYEMCLPFVLKYRIYLEPNEFGEVLLNGFF